MSNVGESPLKVSVVIKALNEEQKIAKAIQSSLDAVATVGGEVILADSCSTDKTIEIASQFPIRIVQLANPNERCCGVGPQLGFQVSQGEYVYILDGDMEFLPGFIKQAAQYLDAHPQVGGVGGLIKEMNTDSLEYIARMERASGHMQAGDVDRLDMGGLYRRTAVEQAGYFSNKNLHSYEEYDLGMRLRSIGWKLHRLDIQSVKHYGHDADPYVLLLKRWKTGYICGLGEVLKAALFQPHFGILMREVRELKLYILTLGWMTLTLTLLALSFFNPTNLLLFLIVFASPILLMATKKRSLPKAFFSVTSWALNALGLVRGLLHTQVSPLEPIQIKVIK